MSKKIAEKKADGQRAISIALIVFLVLAVLFAVFSIVRYSTGIIPRSLTAVSAGSQKLSAMEVSMMITESRASFVSSWGSYLGINSAADLEAMGNQASLFDSNMTWNQYFVNQGINSAVNVAVLLDLAAKDGRTLSELSKAGVDAEINNMRDHAESQGVSLNKYISGIYGNHSSERDLRSLLEKQYLVNEYSTEIYNGYKNAVSDDAVAEYYAEHITDFDVADFYSYAIPYAGEGENADEDAELLSKDAAEALANEILESVTADNFDAVVADHEDEDFVTALNEGMSLSNSGLEEGWIRDGAQVGDKTVLEDTSNDAFVLVLLKDRYLPQNRTVNARHLLVSTQSLKEIPEDATEEEIAAINEENAEIEKQNSDAKTKAEDLFSELRGVSEDEFAIAAARNTDDTGSVSTGGLYENIYEGRMVEEFDAWVFDPARQPGDMDIVETDYGYHIMYFVSEGDLSYVVSIKQALANDEYQPFVEDTVKNAEYKVDNFALSLVNLL